ncbi:MAG: LacI family DNA-binding transcriptional regulator [Spirochaetaceae bacterium]|jgi:LacI family transcriptional regulator|nr:LacI family DNA-binding transcriptional regulator [Spirochaetaceae bacterium]
MKPTIKMSDIAKELSVSTVTVSKALAGKDGVSDALRKAIVLKAEELGYVYNSLPRNMLEGRHYLIGILIASKFIGESSFYWIFYRELLRVINQTPYLGVLEIISDEDELHCVLPSMLRAKRIDGVIILGQMGNPYITMIASKITQCVFLDFYSEIGSGDCVASNNFLGSYNLTKLLIASGHRRIGFIGSTAATTSILDRYLGFCKAMMEAGLPTDAAIEDRDDRGFYIDIMLRPEDYTAYVCNNDQIAGLLINQLRRLGLKVPRDVSLVGFDNESEVVTSGIGVTSWECNIAGMSELAVSLLIQHIESPAYVPRGHSFIDGRVVMKQSISPPPKS